MHQNPIIKHNIDFDMLQSSLWMDYLLRFQGLPTLIWNSQGEAGDVPKPYKHP